MKHFILEFFRWTVIVVCYFILALFFYYIIIAIEEVLSSPSGYTELS